MRPKQWTKNVFLFAGLIFSMNFKFPWLWLKVIAGFLLFCGISGAVYILNDIFDYHKDKLHPEKRKRPIASNRISREYAFISLLFLIIISLTAAYLINFKFFLCIITYFVLNLLYSMYLKNIVIFDVLLISIGFVLRALAGAVIIDVKMSSWLLICTLFLALFLALCKRRHEILLMENLAGNHRAVLNDYTAPLLDQLIKIVSASTLMAYSLYAISASADLHLGTQYLWLTIPLVLFGIFRYLYLVHTKNLGGSPEVLLTSDHPMIADLVLWVLVVLLLLTLGRTQ